MSQTCQGHGPADALAPGCLAKKHHELKYINRGPGAGPAPKALGIGAKACRLLSHTGKQEVGEVIFGRVLVFPVYVQKSATQNRVLYPRVCLSQFLHLSVWPKRTEWTRRDSGCGEGAEPWVWGMEREGIWGTPEGPLPHEALDSRGRGFTSHCTPSAPHCLG